MHIQLSSTLLLMVAGFWRCGIFAPHAAVLGQISSDRIICDDPEGRSLTDVDCAVLQRNSSNRCAFDGFDYFWKACRFMCDGHLTATQSGKKCLDLCNKTNVDDPEYYTVPYVRDYCTVTKPTTIPPTEIVTPNSTSSLPNQTISRNDVIANTTTAEPKLDGLNKTVIIVVSVIAGCAVLGAVTTIVCTRSTTRRQQITRLLQKIGRPRTRVRDGACYQAPNGSDEGGVRLSINSTDQNATEAITGLTTT